VHSHVSLGADRERARQAAYAAADEIKWDGEHHRTDIAEEAAAGRIELADIYGAPEAPAAGGTGRAAGEASGATAGPAAAAPELPGWRHVYSGKVRDLYIPEAATDVASAESLLMVASDRISAYDWVLDSEIPDKGKVLTGLSLWWFDQLSEVIGNHVISSGVPEAVRGRGLIVQNLAMLPVECV